MNLPHQDISYKWNYTTCGFFWLVSLIQHVFKVHLHCSTFLFDWIFHCMDIWHCPFISWWTFGLFLPLLLHTAAIMSNAATDIYAQIFVWIYVSSFLKDIPTSATAGSYGKCVFNHLRNCQTVFQTGCTILHSHQQCMMTPLLHILTNTCY